MRNKIVGWCKDCEYVAVEDYAYGKSGAMGLIFNLAEFEGNIKISLFEAGKKLRWYAVNQIKKFFTEYGLSDKISMYQTWQNMTTAKPDLSDLPEVDNGHGVSPTSDIVDAFAICEYLRTELSLRRRTNFTKRSKYKEDRMLQRMHYRTSAGLACSRLHQQTIEDLTCQNS